ncbi:hypothetical protein B0T25DRAFT_59010 [Lasiosphaeria hispida]|uniref:HNH nuclease domain-containing protein n=1 Tax=Lasiosphaeria hispida TaxID=260671 RepID=A0AAJ0HWV4_9PEZI|nr:hypothetical protein B0T25DRAFT_59010 [Lasiosphaeria hispida]
MAAPGHPSLLDGIDFSRAQSLSTNPQLRTQAINRFHHVVTHFEAGEPTRYNNDYNRPALIRLTFQYARSPESQNRFLVAFFHRLLLGMTDGHGDIILDNGLRSLLFAFAEDLLLSLFFPLLAAGNQYTPQITPFSYAAIQNETQEERDQIQTFTGTPRRLTTLRSSCLVRDRHRCAIICLFEKEEARQRLEQQDPQDDDGNTIDSDDEYSVLEVAHILPHSLTKQKDGQLV